MRKSKPLLWLLITGTWPKELQNSHRMKELQKNNPKVYWVVIAREDFLYSTVIKLKELYDEIGFKYTYRENEGVNDWSSWRLYLSEFAPMCFK